MRWLSRCWWAWPTFGRSGVRLHQGRRAWTRTRTANECCPRVSPVVTGPFILDYFLLVFFAASGLFLIVGACKGLSGLLLLRHRYGSFLLGLVLLAGSFTWFFLSDDRNVPDTAGGLNGNQQFAYFFAGLAAALASTLAIASLVNRRLGASDLPPEPGLDALKRSNYVRALHQTWRQVRPKSDSTAPNCPGGRRPDTGA